MTNIGHNGGPAFPQHSVTIGSDGVTLTETVHGGMLLRDWYAGQALVNPDICRRDDYYPQKTTFAFADAMLAEREKGGAK